MNKSSIHVFIHQSGLKDRFAILQAKSPDLENIHCLKTKLADHGFSIRNDVYCFPNFDSGELNSMKGIREV